MIFIFLDLRFQSSTSNLNFHFRNSYFNFVRLRDSRVASRWVAGWKPSRISLKKLKFVFCGGLLLSFPLLISYLVSYSSFSFNTMFLLFFCFKFVYVLFGVLVCLWLWFFSVPGCNSKKDEIWMMLIKHIVHDNSSFWYLRFENVSGKMWDKLIL